MFYVTAKVAMQVVEYLKAAMKTLESSSGDFTAARPRGRPPMRWRDQIPADTGRSEVPPRA